MLKRNAISSTTPENVVFGAGIVVKNLVWDSNDWTYDELGATSGGNKLFYTREFLDLDLDGKQVKIEGMDLEIGSVGQVTMNLAEYKEDTLTTALGLAQDTEDTTTGYACYKPAGKPTYVDNLGFVGFTASGKPVIAIFDRAVCLGAYELEAKNKEQGVIALVFDAVQKADATDFTKLPVRFYYPKATV
jgi:hypothetical protein